MNPYAPKDIRLDHPLYWTLIDRQMGAVAEGDDRSREHVEDQLRDLIDDPEATIEAWEDAEAAMDEAAYGY